jgi:RNA polymerase sigma factor (sigma-70 family)
MSKEQNKQDLFEQTILPHIDAAYNLARWLINDGQDAEDIVQESFLRAYKYFRSFQGGNSRSWLLAIVRNTCYNWLHQNQAQGQTMVELDDEMTGDEMDMGNPEQFLQIKADHQLVSSALEKLPVEYRELIVLRELEELSYKEIALITRIPLGTVMSRLARARQHLKERLGQPPDGDGINES